MKVVKINDKRIYLEYPTIKELNLAFYRLSEFFEGELKGKIFSDDQFIEIWTDKNGEMKKLGKGEGYFAFWDGYNVPVKVINNFIKKFASLSDREIKIFQAISSLSIDGYVVAGIKGDKNTLKHELAHGLFFDNKEYRETAQDLVNTLSKKTISKFIKHLREMKYHDSVLIDEIHAYLVAYDKNEYKEIFPTIKFSEIKNAVIWFYNLYKNI